jgi:hypothetical protein
MKKKLRAALIILAAGGLLVSAASLSAYTEIEKTTMDGMQCISGGVGMGERQRMESMAADYNLKLVFAMDSGNYLADITVTITNSAGAKELMTTADGPWVYAKVPQGTYRIEAVHDGKRKTKIVDAGSGMQVVMFHWK